LTVGTVTVHECGIIVVTQTGTVSVIGFGTILVTLTS